VPYNALIIARERMNVYAYISIFEVIFKLIIVYLLVILDYDKLILYALLLFVIAFFVRLIEKEYCKKYFEESKYSFQYDKEYTKTLLVYSGWNLFGNIAAIGRVQGANILLNLFFGTVLNAAYGITTQVQGVVMQFVSNFQIAFSPQIIKNYAINEQDKAFKLTMQSCKFSFFIMLIVVFPILLNTDYILNLWLNKVPQYTAGFIQITLISVLIDVLSGPLMTIITATGKIKFYHIIVGGVNLLVIPISYFFLIEGYSPSTIFIISLFFSFLLFWLRLLFVKRLLNIDILPFIKIVVFKIVFVVLLSSITLISIIRICVFETGIYSFLLSSMTSILVISIAVLTVGTTKNETKFIVNLIKKNRNV
jgi:O-antigen/teichoic acid export membrane protein